MISIKGKCCYTNWLRIHQLSQYSRNMITQLLYLWIKLRCVKRFWVVSELNKGRKKKHTPFVIVIWLINCTMQILALLNNILLDNVKFLAGWIIIFIPIQTIAIWSHVRSLSLTHSKRINMFARHSIRHDSTWILQRISIIDYSRLVDNLCVSKVR